MMADSKALRVVLDIGAVITAFLVGFAIGTLIERFL